MTRSTPVLSLGAAALARCATIVLTGAAHPTRTALPGAEIHPASAMVHFALERDWAAPSPCSGFHSASSM